MMSNYLLDQDFLRELDLTRDKDTYAKIILLTKDEDSVYEVQGKITQGSVNIDGNSAVRRTCSLTMVAADVDITNTYWALKNKFKLEVGIKNTINSQYPEIIWFKQGTFVFTSLNMSVQGANFTISINGKDKMCLLNGEVGGSINASTDFGQFDDYSTGVLVRTPIPIIDIIKNAVHVYGGEPKHNIILNDIDEFGLELLEYRADKELYMLRDENTMEVNNISFNKNQWGIIGDNFIFIDRTNQSSEYNTFDYNGKTCGIIEIKYGDTVGYRKTELTYPGGELIANVGESLVTVLDKIKNTFSDFEYFYDIDGRFIFQKKKTYINTSWNNQNKEGLEFYAEDAAYTSSTSYSFEEGQLLSAFTSAPQILNIRNDYSVWGKRTTSSGEVVPVHMRYAIDIKPTKYVNWEGIKYYYTENEFNNDDNCYYGDWRELIYQMASDYLKHGTEDNFAQKIQENNPEFIHGVTGYENYYTDIQGFWRQLYNPKAYESVLEKEWAELDITKEASKGEFSTKTGFNRHVTEAPELLNFWFDFMDADSEMGKYSVAAIGDRPKAVNNDKVKAIYFEEIPQVLFLKQNEVAPLELTGYTFIRMTSQMENYFTISAQGLSAKDEIDSLLYQHTYASDSVTLTAVPIYYLQPNTRILVKDSNTGINGEYIVNKITIPLQYNGTSSITAAKAVERIY